MLHDQFRTVNVPLHTAESIESALSGRASPNERQPQTVARMRERYVHHLGQEKLFMQGYLPNLDPLLRREPMSPLPNKSHITTPPVLIPHSPQLSAQHSRQASTANTQQFIVPASAVAEAAARPFLAAGSMKSSIFNLTSATLGAGALSLPYAIYGTGLALGTVLLLVVCLLSVLSTLYIVHVINYTELKSYEEMAMHSGGRMFALFVEVNLILFCFGTAVGYLISVGDMAGTIMSVIVPKDPNEWSWWEKALMNRELVLSAVTLCLLWPLSITEKVNELRFTCFLGVLSIFFLASVVAIRAVVSGVAPSIATVDIALWPRDMTAAVRGLALMIFAYACQPNVPAIYTELEHFNTRRMSKVSVRAAFLCFLTYMVMGGSGFLLFGLQTDPNILANFGESLRNDGLVMFAFAGMAFAVVFAYPMNIFPCRFSLETAMFHEKPEMITRTTSVVISSITVAMSLLLALYLPSISDVFSVVGSTAGAFVSFILPGWFYLKLMPGPITHHRKLKALALVILGTGIAVFATTMCIYDIYQKKTEGT
eukprot:GDKI01025261.1.p1 GENE.GDKI01025261.1~~GDKI01025261.1.p1  ORF type:complete len:540 (-),score=102.97 GDKI01025261.1:54-1673(-)